MAAKIWALALGGGCLDIGRGRPVQREKERMNNDILYVYHQIPLQQERVRHANSKMAPWSLELIKIDYFVVLHLDGECEISIDDGDYFPLATKMRLSFGGKRRRIDIINSAQEGKFLKLLISRKSDLEVVKP